MLYGSLADFSLYTEYLTPSVGNWHVLQLLPRPQNLAPAIYLSLHRI